MVRRLRMDFQRVCCYKRTHGQNDETEFRLWKFLKDKLSCFSCISSSLLRGSGGGRARAGGATLHEAKDPHPLLSSIRPNWPPFFLHIPLRAFLEGSSLVAQSVKNPPAMQETRVWSHGLEDPLEKGMATHSSILAWENLMDRGAWWATVHGVARVGHNFATKSPPPLVEDFAFQCRGYWLNSWSGN